VSLITFLFCYFQCRRELHNLYLSPDTIRQIKSRTMRWAGHVARMGEGGEGLRSTGFWWEIPQEKYHSEDQGVDGRMGSKWTLGRLAGGCGVDSPCSG
jgi:hypothetical protein